MDDLEPEDLFQYIVTAVLLGLYLEQRTKFFSDRLDIESLSLSNNSTSTSKKNSNQDELLQYVCCLLLRHITQLVCNGHAIYEVGNCETDLDDDEGEWIVYEYWFFIATQMQ